MTGQRDPALMEDSPGTASSRQRALYRLLTLIFLSTLPCYCAGIFALIAFRPAEQSVIGPAGPVPLVLGSPTATNTPRFTPTPSVTPGGPTVTLHATPTQFVPPPTDTPTPTATNTPLPTDTNAPTSTNLPTNTPTLTLTPTNTKTGPVDTDGDGLSDDDESNIYFTNPTKPDTDGDGLNDGDEVNTYGTDPTDPDTDADGMDDGWEVTYSPDLDPLVDDAADDPDADTFDNLAEYTAGTDPTDDTSHP